MATMGVHNQFGHITAKAQSILFTSCDVFVKKRRSNGFRNRPPIVDGNKKAFFTVFDPYFDPFVLGRCFNGVFDKVVNGVLQIHTIAFECNDIVHGKHFFVVYHRDVHIFFVGQKMQRLSRLFDDVQQVEPRFIEPERFSLQIGYIEIGIYHIAQLKAALTNLFAVLKLHFT